MRHEISESTKVHRLVDERSEREREEEPARGETEGRKEGKENCEGLEDIEEGGEDYGRGAD